MRRRIASATRRQAGVEGSLRFSKRRAATFARIKNFYFSIACSRLQTRPRAAARHRLLPLRRARTEGQRHEVDIGNAGGRGGRGNTGAATLALLVAYSRTCTRLPLRSHTAKRPCPSTTIPMGPLNWPLPPPWLPMVRTWAPSLYLSICTR